MAFRFLENKIAQADPLPVEKELTGEEIVRKSSYYVGAPYFNLPTNADKRLRALDYLATIGFNASDWLVEAKDIATVTKYSSLWLYSKKYIQEEQRRYRINKTRSIIFGWKQEYKKASQHALQYLRFDERG